MATSLRSVSCIRPLLDRVLVQRIQPESKTASGIFLPEKSLEKLSEGKVIAVGPGGLDKDGKTVKTSVKVGDKVIIPAYGGSNIKVGDQEYQFYHDHELLATISS
ncbi:hypothetical protein T552_02042 [Pneumocystis carinii B80]|uniref:10 kDa heat shock protein, mitochondrial n=1 Tax=Pneumocystis carinii (strain B80) TaxID=1408658 RepID=A0A0W4ZIJ2_PNEC8|nr:hypothetical protein T552_02042 [Pneumocystis carinii B80]KTW28183.1 hypothetical protein T552_02042 [Pneumocystis carinii B80]